MYVCMYKRKKIKVIPLSTSAAVLASPGCGQTPSSCHLRHVLISCSFCTTKSMFNCPSSHFYKTLFIRSLYRSAGKCWLWNWTSFT